MEVVHRDRMLIVGLEVKAEWQALWTEMPEAWEELRARADEIENQAGDVYVDVTVEVEDDIYTQLVGAEVDEAGAVPDGMTLHEVPAATYIHHRHIGPPAGIPDTFGLMYDWADEQDLPAGDFKLDMGYTPAGDEKEHHLYIRVEE